MAEDILIEDYSLRKVLERVTGGEISAEKLASVTEIDAPRHGIKSLAGLEYCKNLTIARLAENQILSVFPLISLSKLIELDLSSNHQTEHRPTGRYEELSEEVKARDADVMGRAVDCKWSVCDKVEVYFGEKDSLEEMTALSRLTGLTRLELERNRIVSVAPFLMLPNLRYLGLRGNRVEDIEPLLYHTGLEGMTVDLRGNPFMEKCPYDVLARLEEKQAIIQCDKPK
jgi:internalin A